MKGSVGVGVASPLFVRSVACGLHWTRSRGRRALRDQLSFVKDEFSLLANQTNSKV